MDILVVTLVPTRILAEFGGITVYWYSALLIVGIGFGLAVSRKIYLRSHSDEDFFFNAVFVTLLGAFIGARLWHVLVFQWQYYSQIPSEILKVWHGGIAIQGAIVGGLVVLFAYLRWHRRSVFTFTDAMAAGLALGQAIGRWGNYFNQELYGAPSSLPWSIFIARDNRLPGFENYVSYHPVFLYESLLDAMLCLVLYRLGRRSPRKGIVTASYFIGYGIIRFCVDLFRIDPMPLLLGLRLSQIISLVFILIGAGVILSRRSVAVPR